MHEERVMHCWRLQVYRLKPTRRHAMLHAGSECTCGKHCQGCLEAVSSPSLPE